MKTSPGSLEERTPELFDDRRLVPTEIGSKQLLAEFRFGLPPIDEQRRIASVLAAFDELIEINERRIELLEDLARSLYREWFVHFRFPGHEDVELVDSELGPIPDGWGVAELDELAGARRGLSWTRENETDEPGGTPVVTIPNIGRRLELGKGKRLIAVSDEDRARFSLSDRDVLVIGSNGNPARVGQAVRVPEASGALFASFLVRVRADPARIDPDLLFFELAGDRIIDALRSGAVGSTSLRNIRITDLRAAKVLLPSSHLQSRFSEVVRTLLATSDQLVRQNRLAATTRDLLLPGLVTGRLDLSEVELGSLSPAEVE